MVEQEYMWEHNCLLLKSLPRTGPASFNIHSVSIKIFRVWLFSHVYNGSLRPYACQGRTLV